MDTCNLWNDALLLDFGPLDEQHKQIFTKIAEIEFLVGEDAPKADIISKLNKLRNDVSEHFSFEEDLMRQCNDTYQFDKHITSHELAIAYIDYALLATERREYEEIIDGFANELFDAVVQHDSDLVSALIGSGIIRLSKKT